MDPKIRAQYGIPQEHIEQSHNRPRALAKGAAVYPGGITSDRYDVGGVQWSAPSGEVQPVVLTVSMPTNTLPWYAAGNTAPDGTTLFIFGVTIECGVAGAWRRSVVDARAGAIQLPPCDSVKVGLIAKTNSGTLAALQAVTLQMALAEGLAPEADAATFTYKCASSFAGLPVPAQARAVALLAEGALAFASSGQSVSLTAAGALYPPFSSVRIPNTVSCNYTIGATDTAGLVQFLIDP